MRSHNRFNGMGMLVIGFSLTMACLASQAWAAGEKYPSQPIQVVIGYAPGSTDMALRPFIEKLPEYLGQPMSFLYKPGAAGSIGASFVAKSKPDGYTLLGSSPSPVLISPFSKEGIGYTLDDFSPICRLVDSPLILVVRADSPWKSIHDVIAEAKKSPGKITYASSGVFGNNHVPVEMFLKLAGLKMTHVPAEGSGPSVTAVLGGHVNMSSVTMSAASPHLRSGDLRLIASFDKQRIKEFPNALTISELGYPVVLTNWYALMAPRKTPPEVVKAILNGCEKVLEEHKGFITDRVAQLALRMAFLNTGQFTNQLKAERDVMREIVKDLLTTVK
jgi:tripartite-type tricarboxylate transporter receptor subunit TctC